MLENIWFIIIIAIIGIILSTDPKTSIIGAQTSQINMLFSSASDGQKFFRKSPFQVRISQFVHLARDMAQQQKNLAEKLKVITGAKQIKLAI